MGSSSWKTDVNALHRLQTQRSGAVLGRDRSICILLGRNAKSCSVADQNANLYKTASIKPTKSSSNADRGAKVGPDELTGRNLSARGSHLPSSLGFRSSMGPPLSHSNSRPYQFDHTERPRTLQKAVNRAKNT